MDLHELREICREFERATGAFFFQLSKADGALLYGVELGGFYGEARIQNLEADDFTLCNGATVQLYGDDVAESVEMSVRVLQAMSSGQYSVKNTFLGNRSLTLESEEFELNQTSIHNPLSFLSAGPFAVEFPWGAPLRGLTPGYVAREEAALNSALAAAHPEHGPARINPATGMFELRLGAYPSRFRLGTHWLEYERRSGERCEVFRPTEEYTPLAVLAVEIAAEASSKWFRIRR